jgi:hypothetical protein
MQSGKNREAQMKVKSPGHESQKSMTAGEG